MRILLMTKFLGLAAFLLLTACVVPAADASSPGDGTPVVVDQQGGRDRFGWRITQPGKTYNFHGLNVRMPPKYPDYATSGNDRQLVWTHQCDKYGNCRGVWKEKGEVWREQGGLTIFQR